MASCKRWKAKEQPLERLQKLGLRWLITFAHERHNPGLEAEGFVWRVVQQER